LKAEGHDRINVSNNPVNLIDPYGLIDWGKLAVGALMVSDGATMVAVAGGVTVGTAVLTRNPILTGGVAILMTPVAVGGVMDIGHGIHTIEEAIKDNDENAHLTGFPEQPAGTDHPCN